MDEENKTFKLTDTTWNREILIWKLQHIRSAVARPMKLKPFRNYNFFKILNRFKIRIRSAVKHCTIDGETKTEVNEV